MGPDRPGVLGGEDGPDGRGRTEFPELAAQLRKDYYTGPNLEIVRWHDKDSDGIFTTYGTDGHLLKQMANPVGEILAHEFARPGLYDELIGQFDDVLAVQVAKARFALLALEAAQKAVQAPIALPSDVQDLALRPGCGAPIRLPGEDPPDRARRIRRSRSPSRANWSRNCAMGPATRRPGPGTWTQSIMTGKGSRR